MLGTWYVTSSYAFDYISEIWTISEEGENLKAELSFYSPHLIDRIQIQEIKREDRKWQISIFDLFRNRYSTIELVKNDDKLIGLLTQEDTFP